MTQKELDRAGRIAQLLDKAHEEMYSYLWPTGCCTVTSLVLAPYLRAAMNIDFHVIVGRAHDCKFHVWVESPEGDVIDPTYGQFDNGPALRVLNARHAGGLGHCGEVALSLDQEEHYRRTIYLRKIDGFWSASSEMKILFDNYTASKVWS